MPCKSRRRRGVPLILWRVIVWVSTMRLGNSILEELYAPTRKKSSRFDRTCLSHPAVELAEQEKQQIFRNICIDMVLSHITLIADIEPHQTEETTPLSESSVLVPVKTYREHPPQLAATNPAFIRFSSSTTGTAKGVVLSHETICVRIHAANQSLQISSQDRIVWVLSMAYHFAVSIVAYLTFGATIILCLNYFGRTLIQTAARHKATIIYTAF